MSKAPHDHKRSIVAIFASVLPIRGPVHIDVRRNEIEVRTHDPNHRMRRTVERDFASENVAALSEVLLPERVR